MTFDEAFNIMKNKYEELTAETVYPESDVGIRFSALAAVLSGLSADISEYSKQLSPYTATGKWLDAFAAEYGISRKSAVRASGSVKIVPDDIMSEAVTVPAGTKIMTAGADPVFFVTDSSVTLSSSNLQATVSVTAVSGGKVYIPAGKLCRFCADVSPFLTVSNQNAVSSGANEESDEELRKRLLAFYNSLPFSNNTSAVKSRVLQYDGVEKASVASDTGLYEIYVKWSGEGSFPSDSIEEFVLEGLPSANLISVYEASAVNADISVTVSAPKRTSFADEITAAVADYINSLDINEKIVLCRLYEIISALDCCESFSVGDISAIAAPNGSSYYQAGNITAAEG